MARIHRQRVPSAHAGASRHTRALEQKTKAPYKVVFEQFTEKKRKLITVLSFNAEAPVGYTFIPAGDPQITNRCKQLAREDGSRVYIVSTSKHKHNVNLSHEVHRVGYHFPSLVVEKACMSLGVSLSQSGHVLPNNGKLPSIHQQQRSVNKRKNTRGLRDNSINTDISQATLDTQAREAIKDLFPKIPDKDLHEIICRAFQKGKDRVGTAIELPLSRRVQLAVVAHIRHMYTNYDRLLRIGTRQEARAQVEKPCLDQLAQWRSDDDDDPNAMEEILREVIVIDDDDDDEYDDSEEKRRSSVSRHNDRDGSVEIISSHAFADEVQMRPVDYSTAKSLTKDDHQYSPESDEREFAHDARNRRQSYMRQLQDDLPRSDRNGIHHHRWQEALHRHRMNQGPVFTVHSEPVLQGMDSPRRGTIPQSEIGPLVRRPERLVQLDSLDRERYQQPQSIPHSQFLPHYGAANLTDHAMGAVTGGPNERFTKTGQVYAPTQHHSHPLGDRQVKFIVSDQEREADYHHHIKPHIVPSVANRRPGTLSHSSRDLQDVIHDPRIQYISRQHEKILPSVEGRSRPLKYQRDSNDLVEQPSKSSPESTMFTHRERNPRIINLSDTELRATKHRRLNDLVVLSPESQPSRDNHQERAYLLSRKHDNQWPDSRQSHTGFVHQSYPDLVPCEDPYELVHQTVARSFLDRQRPAQILQTHMDVTGQQPHIMNNGLERPSRHERVEVPLVDPSSVENPHAFLNTAHKSVNFSQSLPTLQLSHKQPPVFHGSLRPHVTSDRDAVQPRHESVNPGGLDVSTSSAARFDEYGQGIQSELAGLSIRPEYRRHYTEDSHGGFDINQKAYLSPQSDSRDVHAYERPRTGIFLREVGSGRQSIPNGGVFRPVEVQSRPLLKHQSSQRSDPEPAHGIAERQKERSIMEASRGNPILGLSSSDNFRRYVSGNDPPMLH
ncbi:hypothetical protein MMC22_003826 [Lobaria immixta]|nr:hypothetical protein [Lobaria immixta]